MCLFVDFRKAFDLVDPFLLLNKLKHYGFDDNAIKLIRNYFNGRNQCVKFNNIMSDSKEIKLGVPQGSVLGPLFFLIFINDLPYFLKQYKSVLFADDTTLCFRNLNYDNLLVEFYSACDKLNRWCKYNRTDINWSKTEIMFICRKMSKDSQGKKKLFSFPESLNVFGNLVKVVSSFKLLGVHIDSKLNFRKHVSQLRIAINKRIYSFNRLFFLSFSVKLQFFKTFILVK